MGIEKGLQQGLQQGLKQGIQQGLQQGLSIGFIQEARESVIEVLEIRFGIIPEDIVRRIKSVEIIETLRSLRRQAMLCKDLNTFREMLDRVHSKGD